MIFRLFFSQCPITTTIKNPPKVILDSYSSCPVQQLYIALKQTLRHTAIMMALANSATVDIMAEVTKAKVPQKVESAMV